MLPPDLVVKLQQCAAHDLVGPRDHWFNRLAAFTTAVFIGLVFELPELRYELKLIARDWIPYFRYRILTPSEHRLHAAKVVAFVGWLLIVIGVGGERYAEVRVKDLDASIQGCSDAKVRAATLEAGDAATSAQQAQDASTAAKSDAKTAHDEAEAAKGVARKADTDANNAEAKVLDAEAKLTEAEKKQAELEESLAPRQLIFDDIVGGPANGLSSREALKPFDDFIVTLFWIRDPEAERAAAWISRALCGMGWTVEAMDGEICHKSTVPDVKSISPSPEWNPPGARELPMRKMPLEGVQIFSYFPVDLGKPGEIRAKRRSKDAADALKGYLEASGWTGIVSEVSPSGTMDPGTISVRVGFRPNPLLGKMTLDKAKKIMNQVLKDHNIPEAPPDVWK